jgi:hypothetical protein
LESLYRATVPTGRCPMVEPLIAPIPLTWARLRGISDGLA